jgi:hypothetical protein
VVVNAIVLLLLEERDLRKLQNVIVVETLREPWLRVALLGMRQESQVPVLPFRVDEEYERVDGVRGALGIRVPEKVGPQDLCRD